MGTDSGALFGHFLDLCETALMLKYRISLDTCAPGNKYIDGEDKSCGWASLCGFSSHIGAILRDYYSLAV